MFREGRTFIAIAARELDGSVMRGPPRDAAVSGSDSAESSAASFSIAAAATAPGAVSALTAVGRSPESRLKAWVVMDRFALSPFGLAVWDRLTAIAGGRGARCLTIKRGRIGLACST